MNAQERQLIDQLFERLATLETAQRDPQAMEAIRQGLTRAPNAVYALVQTVLIQEEALKRAAERIEELEAQNDGAFDGEEEEPAGFLDSMRDALFGRGQDRGQDRGQERGYGRGSVPSASPSGHRPMGLPPGIGGGGAGPRFGANAQPAQGAGVGAGGGFLGTAGAAAAGVLGGALLMNSLQGLFGGDQAKAATAQPGQEPAAQQDPAADDERQYAQNDDYDDYDAMDDNGDLGDFG